MISNYIDVKNNSLIWKDSEVFEVIEEISYESEERDLSVGTLILIGTNWEKFTFEWSLGESTLESSIGHSALML